jgi:D-aspartate ligase
MSPSAPRIVLIGLDSITGLQSARTLRARGIGVVGVASNARHPACRTNACERIVIAPKGGEELIGQLFAMRHAFSCPPVLLPCTDLSVLAIAEHREALLPWFRAVLPPAGVTELLLDKAAFHLHAEAHGLPVIRGAVIASIADAERAAHALAFPCALKPAVKTPSWQSHTSTKVFRVETPEELIERYLASRAWTDRFLAQEWIEGPDTAHLTCNAYFVGRGRAHLTYVSQKVRQWPLEGGVGCLSHGVVNDDVRAITLQVFGSVTHRGLGYLEVKRDPRSGQFVIVEPNVGRPTGRSAAADAEGIELLYTHYCDALGWPLPARHEQGPRSRSWIYLRQDVQSAVQHVRAGDLSVPAWLRSLSGCRQDVMFRLDDPRPFFADLRSAAVKQRRRKEADASDVMTVDMNVHGVVGVRLIDASAADVAMVKRQIGSFVGTLPRDADLIIRFADHVAVGHLQWVEVGRTGFSEYHFYALQSGKRPAVVKYPLHRLGHRMEIVCQRGARSIPHLITIITLLAMDRGCVPLHASAFVYDGVGALVTGWAKGGKTEALLAFSRHGAEYVGDEWILMMPDGTMAGLPEQIRLQDWHLQQISFEHQRLPLSKRLMFRGIRGLASSHRAITRTPLKRLWPASMVNDALPALKRQLNVQINPMQMFKLHEGVRAPADIVFFMNSHDGDDISVTRACGTEIAARMAASVEFERLPLLSTWIAHKFAFPDAANELFERLPQMQKAGLSRLLSDKRAFDVRHPYPCRLDSLFDAMAPAFDSAARRVSRRALLTTR